MIKGRFAPTPSGYLHAGNAFNFLLTWLLVRKKGGKILLRIDDLDAPRFRPEYAEDVFLTLNWLGLDWDEGPQTVDEIKLWSQHTRLGNYRELIAKLRSEGDLFACSCSRSTLALAGNEENPCLQTGLPFNDDVNWRLRTGAERVAFYDHWLGKEISVNLAESIREPVIHRRDGLPAYQVASIADDALFHINLVVRGTDLLPATALQLHLAALCGIPAFKQTSFYHHPLLTGLSGEKLSKSAGSSSMKEYRKAHTVQEFYRKFASWLHLPQADEVNSLQELEKLFGEM